MTWCGCEGEKRSNCGEATVVKWVQVHVWWTPDDGLRFGHYDGADLHVVNGERCHPCERYLQHQVNGDEIGEA